MHWTDSVLVCGGSRSKQRTGHVGFIIHIHCNTEMNESNNTRRLVAIGAHVVDWRSGRQSRKNLWIDPTMKQFSTFIQSINASSPQ
mmetsp:Transcript_25725/g.71872  ORF Transcript_25725/g.71872 Transcript_25725/m.71872 type:complete len:86 (+) Transcript_25725:121-378(+)